MKFNQRVSVFLLLVSFVTLIGLFYSTSFAAAVNTPSNSTSAFDDNYAPTSTANEISNHENVNRSFNRVLVEPRNNTTSSNGTFLRVVKNKSSENASVVKIDPIDNTTNSSFEAVNSTLVIKIKPHFGQVNDSPTAPNITFDVFDLRNSFYHLPNGLTAMDPDTGNALNAGTYRLRARKKVRLNRQGTPVAEVWLNLETGNADLGNLQISSTNSDSEKKSVIDWRSVTESDHLEHADHALYVDATWSNGAYVCPTAYNTNEVNSQCEDKISFTHSDCISGITTNGVTCTISNGLYELNGLSGTGIAANGNARLVINDSVEGSTITSNTAVTFYAHYQNSTGNTHIAGAWCQVLFDDASGVWVNMTEDLGNSRYAYTKAAGFATLATHTWEVNCSKATFNTLDVTDTVQVGAASVPEFNDYALMAALLLAGLGGIGVVNRREIDA